MEHFYTLQGEGFHQGKAAYFVRLAGCDVGCVWCDVKDSWQKDKHPVMSANEIVAEIQKTPTQMVVITGGEPLMYNLLPLTTALHQLNYQVNIETSGAYPLSGNIDWICVSPKKFKAPLEEVLPFAHELKVVIFNASDFLWAEKYAAKVNSQCKLFLQPEWDKSTSITPLIIDYIKANPKWEFSLQMHKYIQVP
ncbi:MAG: 7-carboxy-7-deazaguanine synthase QueE [Chitinophagaceae bacterium]|nr:7-carboxy-7-deazaguanine synthase QueE [Chitinophagaceae bacterium]